MSAWNAGYTTWQKGAPTVTVNQPTSPESTEAEVLVVGAGPVGTIVALELAHHNVRSIVVERSLTASRHPKMDYINGRSMELLRRLGLAEGIRSIGVDSHHSADFLWTYGFGQPPVAVWHHPSVADLVKRYREHNDGSTPAEPYQRVQGSIMEDYLRRQAREHPLVDLRESWTFTELRQDCGGVIAQLVRPDRRRVTIHAKFLVACDGANSTVRQFLGIPLEEAGPRVRHCSVFFSSRDPRLRTYGRAFVTVAPRGLTLVSRDEEDSWTGSIPVLDDAPFTQDPITLLRECLGTDFTVDEVRSVADWTGSLSVATSYRLGSIFLAGDSAHQFFPAGGHGANTGIADAVNLGWKLAAVVQGWGGEGLLDSYDAERRPVALFNREMCTNLLEVWRRFRRLVDLGVSREQIAGFLAEETHQIDNLGVHFDYRYTDSPTIYREDSPAPSWRWRRIEPTTWPGCRAPAIRLADGSQSFDRLGPGFTLVDFSEQRSGQRLVEAAGQRGIPVRHLPLSDPAARKAWQRELVLVRPDQHVAWRGNQPPSNWDAVLDRVTGQTA